MGRMMVAALVAFVGAGCGASHAVYGVHGAKATQVYEATDDTVVDSRTQLTWQRAVAPSAFEWADAARFCNALQLQGQQGWRLPDERELATIAVASAGEQMPAIDSRAFPETPAAWFWTQAPDTAVDFGNKGHTAQPTGAARLHVRCVRGTAKPGTLPPSRVSHSAPRGRSNRGYVPSGQKSHPSSDPLGSSRPPTQR